MALFTVILEYRGGTYVSQVEAADPAAALKAWAKHLDPAPIAGLGPRRKVQLIAEIDQGLADGDAPVPLRGIVNYWCTTVLFQGGFMIFNLVKTDRK